MSEAQLRKQIGQLETEVKELSGEIRGHHVALQFVHARLSKLEAPRTGTLTPKASADPQALADGPDPASPEFAVQVEQVAENLWKADPGKNTPARNFREDYSAVQDRYREMAVNLLDPSGSEDPKR